MVSLFLPTLQTTPLATTSRASPDNKNVPLAGSGDTDYDVERFVSHLPVTDLYPDGLCLMVVEQRPKGAGGPRQKCPDSVAPP